MTRSRFLGLILVSAGVSACAAGPQKSAAPPAEDRGSGARPVTDGESRTGDAESTDVPASLPAARLAVARGELDRASADLEAGLAECSSACRALASMERAADHLCELDGAKECSSAKERVERARAKVKGSGCLCQK